MPKTVARTRAVKKDAVLEAALDVARAGAEAVAHPRPVGEHVGFEMVSDRLGTHYFASTDAVFSIMQMPPGVPVATVAIDGAKNAALLAAKILAASDGELLDKLKAYTAKMKEEVQAKAAKLDEIGYEAYLNR